MEVVSRINLNIKNVNYPRSKDSIKDKIKLLENEYKRKNY